MVAIYSNNNQIARQLRDRLKTTGMGLGLVRLQMDMGLPEEAKKTLSSLQRDFQLLYHGVDNPLEIMNPYAALETDRRL